MASRHISILLLLLLLLAGVFIFGMEQAEAAGIPVTTARKEDIPFIKCRVCEAMSKQLIRQVNRKRKKIAPTKVSRPPTTSIEVLTIVQKSNFVMEFVIAFQTME